MSEKQTYDCAPVLLIGFNRPDFMVAQIAAVKAVVERGGYPNCRTEMVQTTERKWSKLPNGNGPNCRMAIDVDRHNLV